MALGNTVQHHALRLHQMLYERSGGMVGHRMIGVPTLLLRSTGRRSGKERCNALVYAQDGEDYVLVASNGGSDHAPGWFFNVQSKPEVEVQIGRTQRRGSARVVRRGETEYDRLWQLVNDNNHARYDAYQRQTSRDIPLVVVSPT